MKRLKKVSAREVKRAFVISQLVRAKKGKEHYLGTLSEVAFVKTLKAAKQKGLSLPEKALDRIIKNDLPRRLTAYNACDWYLASASPKELGPWRRAGSLPLAWTHHTLEETAHHVRHALEKHPRSLKRRAQHAIPSILATSLPYLSKEKYLFPIAFVPGVGTNGRKRLKMKVDASLDDGNMRAIALAVSGAKRITLYLGVPKKKKAQ